MKTKFIFVTGGVVSSIGKGLASASLGALLEARGLRVANQKTDYPNQPALVTLPPRLPWSSFILRSNRLSPDCDPKLRLHIRGSGTPFAASAPSWQA